MTIAAYTGLPGHGKSYGVVENVIKPALEQKREVFTNIPMNKSECLKRFNMAATQFTTEDILDNPAWWSDVFVPGSVLVIDEVWRLWPSGLNAKSARNEDKEFLAEHRHIVGDSGNSTEIILVTQDLSQIANFARSLVETTFRVTKLSRVGMHKNYRVDVYFGPVTGVTPPISKREREIHGKFKKEVYSLYQSHTKSITGTAGNEKRIDSRYNVLGGFTVKLGFLVFFVALVGVYFGLNHTLAYYGLKSEDKQPAEKSIVVKPKDAKPLVKAPAKTVFKFLSKATDIFFTGSIAKFKNGRESVEYNFEALIGGSMVYLTRSELAKMKYDIQVINNCMAIISGPDYEGYALCRKHEESKGWVENLVVGSNGAESI